MSRTTYLIVTLAYWALMLTDGALRMLTLLHFHALGFTPVQLAFLFVLYEIAGILTNLFGGYLGARFGLRHTLFAGLALQTIALLALTLVDSAWPVLLSVPFVMAVQALSGIAKDLTKMSSKSSVKLLVNESEAGSQATLFKWVAALTGSKNAIKGIGFFLGGFLLASLGFDPALTLMAALIGLILLLSLATVRGDFGKSTTLGSSLPATSPHLQKTRQFLRSLFTKPPAIRQLARARACLFAARDVWFVVGTPIFFYEKLHWNFTQIGTLMAAWVIAYGFIQALAPNIVRVKKGDPGALPRAVRSASTQAFPLVLIATLMALAELTDFHPALTIIGGLFLFGFFFALNSSVHSYLILAYSEKDAISLNVGYYYMSNAVGRLAGTLLSGTSYLLGGLPACFLTSAALALAAALLARTLPTCNNNEPITNNH